MPNENQWKKRIIKFMTAQTISLLGSSLVQFAIIWHITLTTSSGSMMALGLSPWFVVYLLFNFLIGISIPCFNAPVNVMIQENVVPGMHGRIFSIMQIANACALPLGTVAFGPLADIISVNTILIINGALVILCAGLNYRHLKNFEAV